MFDTGLFRIGTFRAAPSHPRFHDSGPITQHLFVFPRTAVAIRHEGKRPFIASPNVVTFYNRGELYRRETVEPVGDVCEWFAPRPSLLAQAVALFNPARGEQSAPFEFSHGPSDARDYLLQRLVFRHVVHSPPEEIDRLLIDEAMTGVLQRLLARVYRARGAEEVRLLPHPRHQELVEEFKATLALRFRDNLSLAELASVVGSSPFHLSRVFRTCEGGTIHHYRHQWRLRKSLELLAAGEGDITDVGLDLGFSSHSHFTAAFHAAFDLVPSAFRRSASGRRARELASRLEASPPAWPTRC